MQRYSEADLAQARQLIQEQAKRNAVKQAILAELFDKQRTVANRWAQGQRFFALCCSRRAGKTQLLARLIAVSLLSSGRNEWTVFCAATFGVAKNIVWDEVVALGKRHQLGWRINETDCTITTPAGAKFRLVGVDDKRQIEKIRGLKYRLVVLDEASTYQDKLPRLYQDVVRPGLVDLNGSLILSGTPGYVCAGYWFDAATAKKHFEVHGWTLRDNPHIKDVDAELASIRAENKWTEEEPTYRREYLGLWINDEGSLVYGGYEPGRNRQDPESFDAREWYCTLGADYGMSDETAFVVIGNRKGDPRTYVLHASKHKGLLPDEVSAEMASLVERFRPVTAVGDAGGLGKTFVEEWNRRHALDAQITLKPAKKADKLAAIQMMNGAFRSANLLIARDAEQLEGEILYLPWADSARTKEHPQYANHASDAALYAYREHLGYALVPRPEPPPPEHHKWSTVEERKARNRKAQGRQWWE